MLAYRPNQDLVILPEEEGVLQVVHKGNVFYLLPSKESDHHCVILKDKLRRKVLELGVAKDLGNALSFIKTLNYEYLD